ncbi:MAG: hypothetical protein PVI54_18400, partial [Desulfobacteraceae bacterium]
MKKYRKKFTIIALTPAGLCCPAIAIAACRSGCIGVLDLEYTKDKALAIDSFKKLSRFTDTDFGIKLGKEEIQIFDDMSESFPNHFRTLILSYMDKSELSAALSLFKRRDLHVLVECATVAQAQSASTVGVDGVIAKGNESGGVIGQETTFILLQRFLRDLSIPIYAQ